MCSGWARATAHGSRGHWPRAVGHHLPTALLSGLHTVLGCLVNVLCSWLTNCGASLLSPCCFSEVFISLFSTSAQPGCSCEQYLAHPVAASRYNIAWSNAPT